ncbi:HisA/HisF-related TIM barrel protein [Bosea sp. (in: a-proteobacteria)]
MLRKRIIPGLLLSGERFVKTRRFADPIYIGDPINTLRIFNEKEVDEIAIFDIDCARDRRRPVNLAYLERLCSECFMPLSYGGGVRDIETMRQLYRIGVEKVVLTTVALDDPTFVARAVEEFGSSSVIGGVDFSYEAGNVAMAAATGGTRRGITRAIDAVRALVNARVGEILLTNIDREGMAEGYDLAFLEEVSAMVSTPIIIQGGAGSVDDLKRALHDHGASAAAAGTLFVLYGPHRAVLITYPPTRDIHG